MTEEPAARSCQSGEGQEREPDPTDRLQGTTSAVAEPLDAPAEQHERDQRSGDHEGSADEKGRGHEPIERPRVPAEQRARDEGDSRGDEGGEIGKRPR